MTIFSPPNSWRVGLMSFSGTAALAFIHSRPILHWAYGDTTAASAEFRQSVLTVGILMAAIAAWVSSSISAPTNAHAPAGAARRGAPLVLSNLSFLFAASGAGFTVGLVPVVWHAATTSVYGSFDLATIAAGYASLFVYVSMGYVLGCILPSYLAVPAALGISYVMVFFTSHVLSLVFDFDVISGLEVPTQVSVIRLMYFGACVGALTLASSAWLRMRSPNEAKVAGVTVALVLLPLIAIWYAANTYPGPLVRADSATPVCEAVESSVVCVHPARAELLPKIADTVRDMSESVGPGIFPASRIVDATLNLSDAEAASAYVLQIQGQSSDWLTWARADIASYAAGIDACYRNAPPDSDAQDVSSAVAAWLMSRTGATPELPIGSPGAERQLRVLQSLSGEEASRRIEAEMPDIRQCAGQRIK